MHRSRSHCRVKHEARSPVKSKIKSRLGPRPSDNFPLVEVFNMDNAVGEIFDSINNKFFNYSLQVGVVQLP